MDTEDFSYDDGSYPPVPEEFEGSVEPHPAAPRADDGRPPIPSDLVGSVERSSASTAPIFAETTEPTWTETLVRYFTWGLLAVLGVFLAVMAIELVGSLVLVVVLLVSSDDVVEYLYTDDGLMVQNLFVQLLWLAVMIPWWLHVSKRGIGLERRPAQGGWTQVARICAIILLGIGLQIVISIVLTLVLELLPELGEEYDELMESSGTDTFSFLTVLSVAIVAPIVEEITFRGVAMQFALRASTPEWNKHLTKKGLAKLDVSSTSFWVANILQATGFAITHLNITQGCYAFVLGLFLGWVFWRTGDLRWSMLLHAVINFSSYFVSEIMTVCELFGLFPLGMFIVPVFFLVWGAWLFKQSTTDTALSE